MNKKLIRQVLRICDPINNFQNKSPELDEWTDFLSLKQWMFGTMPCKWSNSKISLLCQQLLSQKDHNALTI